MATSCSPTTVAPPAAAASDDDVTLPPSSSSDKDEGEGRHQKEDGERKHEEPEEDTFAKALAGCFAVEDSPIWADGSTEEYAAELEGVMGGAARLAELTGSRAHLRQGAPQIMKVCKKRCLVYWYLLLITRAAGILDEVGCEGGGGGWVLGGDTHAGSVRRHDMK